MSLLSPWRSSSKHSTSAASTHKAAARKPRYQPRLESLEDRTVPALVNPVPQAPVGQQFTAQPQFSWTSVSGADHYDVWVDDITTGVQQVLRNTNVTDITMIPSASLPSGDSFQWWVRALSGVTDASGWARGQNFTIVRPDAPVPVGPSGTIVNGLNTPIHISWNAVAGITNYDLWIDDLTTGKSPFFRNPAVFNTSANITFPTGHTYRWFVRSNGDGGDVSLWSTALTFYVSLGAPPTPNLPKGETVTTRPVFNWSAVTGADFYDVWVNDITTGQSPIIRNANVTILSLQAPFDLAANHDYQWWVRAGVKNGPFTDWSAATSFTVENLLTPKLQSPTGPTMGSASPTFTWTNPGITNEIWLDDLTAGYFPAQRYRGIGSTTSFTPPAPLTPGHSYRWYVRAFTASGLPSLWSAPATFDLIALSAPTNLGFLAIQPTVQTLSWNAVTGADYYDVWLDDVSTGVSQFIRNRNVVTTFITVNLNLTHSYRWWVRAFNNGGNYSDWSISFI